MHRSTRRFTTAFVFASIALLNACADSTSGPGSPSDRLRPTTNIALTSCTDLPPAGIPTLINNVFGEGSVDANSALGKWDNIQKQLAAGNTSGAIDKTWSLVEFMIDKQDADKLPVGNAFALLVRALFCAVGVDAGIPTGSNAWIVYPTDQDRTLITEDGNAGVKIPAAGVDATSIIAITPSPTPLNTLLDKYTVQVNGTETATYEFSKYPSNVFSVNVTVAVCAVAPDDVLDRLVLGHNIGGTGFRLLAEETSFLSCVANASNNTAPSLFDRVVAFVMPTIAYAAIPGASGIGGSTIEFSPIGPVDPTINVTKNAAGPRAPIGSLVSPAPSVTLATPNGTALPGIPVAFAVTAGGGSIAPASVNSSSSGLAASTSWRMGLTPGTNSASATPGLGGPAVTGVVFTPLAATFTATATPASAIVYSGGPSGSYVAGTTLPTTTATVVDANGQTVEGFTGTITLSANPGPIASGTVSRAATAGVASFNDIVINKAGSHTLSVATTLGSTPVSDAGSSFTISTGTATTLSINGGNNQTASVGSVLGIAPLVAPSVLVSDNFGNPVSGVTVYWLPGGVSGALSPLSSTTGGSGTASTTWALLAGVNEMIASLDATPGASGRFQPFTATGTTTNSSAPFASCGPGNQKDPITSHFARMDGTNKNITNARFFFSVSGSANQTTPYNMTVTAHVKANGSATINSYTSTPTTVYLVGNNAEQKEANFNFPTPIVSGGGTKIVFEISTTAPNPNNISVNVGDCPPGTKCSVKPACPVVEVPTTNSFTASPARMSFGVRLFGN